MQHQKCLKSHTSLHAAALQPLLTDTPNSGHLHITDNLLMYMTQNRLNLHVMDKKHLPNCYKEVPLWYLLEGCSTV